MQKILRAFATARYSKRQKEARGTVHPVLSTSAACFTVAKYETIAVVGVGVRLHTMLTAEKGSRREHAVRCDRRGWNTSKKQASLTVV